MWGKSKTTFLVWGVDWAELGLRSRRRNSCFVPVESELSVNYLRRVGRKVWLFGVTKM